MKSSPESPQLYKVVIAGLCILGVFTMGGCVAVPAYEQALLGKPNMEFGDETVFNDEPGFQSSFEPGSPNVSGANSTGCAACR